MFAYSKHNPFFQLPLFYMLKKLIFILYFASFSFLTYADSSDIIKRLTPFVGKISKENVVKTDFEGIYEVITTNPIGSVFVSADGRYLIDGKIIDLSKKRIMSHSTKVKLLKKQIIDNISDADKIIFKAKNEKYVVNVWTDVDCPFCKKLHSKMQQMNDLGITVKYLASPLAGLHPKSQGIMEKIWCAKDRVVAMDEYKAKHIVPSIADCVNPVAAQLKISQQLGVNGTPSIFLSDGSNIAGYIEPQRLLEAIKQISN